ncbi:MAG: hypothetical protein K8R77_11990, partial [Anaerolineaceae bacterium]|nr:hypothetical protein [Anaerolineaceae bacterium]
MPENTCNLPTPLAKKTALLTSPQLPLFVCSSTNWASALNSTLFPGVLKRNPSLCRPLPSPHPNRTCFFVLCLKDSSAVIFADFRFPALHSIISFIQPKLFLALGDFDLLSPSLIDFPLHLCHITCLEYDLDDVDALEDSFLFGFVQSVFL